MRRRICTLAGLLVAAAASPCVHAVVIEYAFSGRVSSVQNLASAIAVGDPFTATLRYDPQYATGSGGPVQTDYSFPHTPADAYALEVTLGHGARYRASGPTGLISILNDFGGARQDWFQTLSSPANGFGGDLVNGTRWTQTTITLKDYQGTLYRDTSLPSYIAQLNSFEEAFATLFFEPLGANGLVNASIHSIQAVVSDTGQAALGVGTPTVVLPAAEPGGMIAMLPSGTPGIFTATYDQQAANEVDFRRFNFFIPGDIFQVWDLHFDGIIAPGRAMDLVFTYDDTGMTHFEELALDILHEVSPGRFVALGGTVDVHRNTITARTTSFSNFYLGNEVPLPATWLLVGLGLTVLAVRRTAFQRQCDA